MESGGYVTTGKVKIIGMEYDSKLKWQQRSNDVLLKISYNDGQEWDKDLVLYGNFNKEKGNWGSALKLKMFFEAVGIENVEYKDDYTISDHYLDKAMGKEFLVLSYPSVKLKDSGKPFWNTFNETMAVSKGRERLKERFASQVRDGWVKDFNPGSDAFSSSVERKELPKKDESVFAVAGLDI